MGITSARWVQVDWLPYEAESQLKLSHYQDLTLTSVEIMNLFTRYLFVCLNTILNTTAILF